MVHNQASADSPQVVRKQAISTKTMKAIDPEIEAQGTLTLQEEIHCHKARIFSVLANLPVVQAWKDAICDGAVYLGKGPFPMSYADRYFQTSRKDISYVTFSIVTAFKEIGFDPDGQELERSQCHISLAQREASEFLIVTFSNNRDTIALLPHRVYWEVDGKENTRDGKADSDEISAETLDAYSLSISLLPAHIEEIKRSPIVPMHGSTTPFQIGFDGRVPKAGTPEAIMPQETGQQLIESDTSILASQQQEEAALRIVHDRIPKFVPAMSVDFLHCQPLLRDFRILVPKHSSKFPKGLEAVINHKVGAFTFPKIGSNWEHRNDFASHMVYADYFFTHTLEAETNLAMFVPRHFVAIDWSTKTSEHSQLLYDLNHKQNYERFGFEMDKAGRWASDIWDIICKYPPVVPTPAEKKQEIWKKALPWPEIEARVALQKEFSREKARRDKAQAIASRTESGKVSPSDVSVLATHYLEKASSHHNEAGDDAT